MTNKIFKKLSEASVTLFQYNRITTQITTVERVYCDVNRYIKCDVFNLDLSLIHLISAKIKLKDCSGDYRSCYVSKITNGVINSPEFTKEAYIQNDSSSTSQLLDITDLFVDNTSNSFSFVIKPGNDITSFSCSSGDAEIFLEFIEDKYSVYKNSKFNVSVGDTTNCVINPLFKKYVTSTKIFSLTGGYLPLDLSLNYSYLMAKENKECFKFSYEQSLYINDSIIYYFDDMFNRHTFIKSNVPSIYYDVSSPGLVLYVETNGYYITDDKTLRLDFNSNGKLTKITKQIDEHKIIENNINYINNKIYSITDDLNRVCLFTYDNYDSANYNITITKPDSTIVTVTIENNVVTSINGSVNNSQINNNIVFKYLGNTSLSILSSVCDYTHDGIEFFYDDNIAFNGYRNYVLKNSSKYQISKNLINTNNKQICIKNYDRAGNLIDEKFIEVDDEGSVVKSYDIRNDEISNVKTLYYTPYSYHPNSNIEPQEISIDLLPDFEIYNFIYDNDEINNPLIHQITGLDTLNDKVTQKYKVNFKTWFREIKFFPYETPNVNLKIHIEYSVNDSEIGSNIICIPLDFSKENIVSYYEKEFTIPRSNWVNIKFYYNASGISCEMNLRNLCLTKAFSIETIDCFNKDTSEVSYLHDNENFCQIIKPNRIIFSSTLDNNSNSVSSVDLTKLDYILTLNSYIKNPSNHHLWYDNGKCMIANINNVVIYLDENNSFQLNTLKVASLSFLVDRTIFVNNLITTNYYKVITEEDYSNIKHTVIETYDCFGKLESVVDSKGNTRNYMYSYSNLEDVFNEEIISIDGKRSYKQHKIIYGNDSIQEIKMDSDYELINSGNGVVSTLHINKLSGQCTKMIMPNNQVIEYNYKDDNFSISDINTTINNINNKNIIDYNYNIINKLNHNNFDYDLTYGSRKELTNIKISSINLINNSYSYGYANTGIETTYPTGYSEESYYDEYGRLYNISSDNNTLFTNTYSDENTYNVVTNGTTGQRNADSLLRVSNDGYLATYYYYDQTDYNDDNYIEKRNDNGYKQVTKITNARLTKLYGYDAKRRIKTTKIETPHFYQKEEFEYINGDKYNSDLINTNKISYKLSTNTNTTSINSSRYYDSISRVSDTSLMINNNFSINRSIIYKENGSYCSNFINRIIYKHNGQVFNDENIEYDSLGNISRVTYNDNNISIEYFYDQIGRLIRENNPILQKSYLYDYDAGGNILSKKEYNFTTTALNNKTPINIFTFSYASIYKDKLIKVNSDNLTYLNNEVLLSSYKNHSFTWSKRNNLTAHYNTSTGNRTAYKYNEKGQRIQKNVRVASNIEKEIYYVYDGNKLLEELVTKKVLYPAGNNGNDLLFKNIYYLYDGDNLIGFSYNNSLYYYSYDCLGNIKYILDSTCNVVAKYEYDAWGNHLVYQKTSSGYTLNNADTFIGNINSIRYKGYYYDVENQLYWVSSRYYSPELCRWISPDSIEYLDPQSINGLNLYAYCGNDPVNRFDPTGHSWESFWNGVGDWFSDNWVKLAIGAGAIALGVLTMGAATLISGAGMAAALSAMGTAAVSSLIQVGISTAISAGIGFAVGGITSGSWEGAVDGMLNGIADGFMWGGIFAGAGQVLSGAMKITRTLAPNFNGAQIGRVKLWSPNAAGNPNTGGTLIKFGRFNRIDSEIGNMIHIHLKLLGRTINHFPIGMIAGGVIGGF